MGVTTFVTPVQPPQTIGSVKIRLGKEEPKPALLLEEVAYTAYYPADISSDTTKARKGVDWFIRPIRESLEGFSTFLGVPTWLLWPIVYLFGSLVKIPAYPNAPLLHPRNIENKPGQTPSSKWPLVIFSHGLGGGRTAYSQICSRLAASGRVVLAVEHRDGTGTVSLPRSWDVDGSKSKPRKLLYLTEKDIHWDDGDSKDTKTREKFALRAEQLAFRHHEMYITYKTFCQLVHKDHKVTLETIDGVPFEKSSWVDDSTSDPYVNCDSDVVLAGHSFGGCTVFSILSTNPPEEYPPIPVERALILDPWLEPLPAPGPVPLPINQKNGENSSNATVNSVVDGVRETLEDEDAIQKGSSDTLSPNSHPRMLVINSENFTLWKPHFPRLQEVVNHWEPDGKHILTVVSSQHTSFSDFPILPVFSSKVARCIFNVIADLSLSFLDDRLEEDLKKMRRVKMETKPAGLKKDGTEKRKMQGEPGDVVVGPY